jgi:hypothetical protein
VRQLAARRALSDGPEVQPLPSRGIGLQHAPVRQVDGRNGSRPREFGDVLMRVEFVLAVGRHRQRQPGERGEAEEEPEQGGAAAHPKRLSPPQQDHHRQHQRDGEAELFGQARIDLEEEGERGDVDEHHVHEGRRHQEGVVLELRQRDQDDDQHQRQRRRGQRAPQHNEPEKVERGPGEDERRLRRRLVLGPEEYAEGGEVDGDKQRKAAGMPAIGAREAVLQVEDGGRHDSRRQPRSGRHSPRRAAVIFLITKLSWQGACASMRAGHPRG